LVSTFQAIIVDDSIPIHAVFAVGDILATVLTMHIDAPAAPFVDHSETNKAFEACVCISITTRAL
jgi:hypothetical protein